VEKNKNKMVSKLFLSKNNHFGKKIIFFPLKKSKILRKIS